MSMSDSSEPSAMNFNIHILGCGSALPTLRHHASSQVVEIHDKCSMIDCGEGTQMQLRRSHIHFSKISRIFISHLHGDHCYGLPGMISSFGMLGRTAPLHLYGPKNLWQMVKPMLELSGHGIDYPLEMHEVDTTRHQLVCEDRSMEVWSIPLEHRMPCCGYLFREKPKLPHLRRDIIDMYGISISQAGNIKNGADGITPDGERIPNHLLVTPASKPRSYAYCSDTRYLPHLHELIEGVDLLYHESTYAEDNAALAEKYMHSTARQAAQVAAAAHAGRLLLGHYSQRYEDERLLLDEARRLFPATELANEGQVISL